MAPRRDRIEQALVDALEGVVRRWHRGQSWTRAEWTRQIQGALDRLGRALGYRTYPSVVGPRGRWLFDMTWTEEDDQGSLLSVPLAAESEWDVPTVGDDLQKLLVARAAHRLHVSEPLPGRSPAETIETLIAEVEKFDGTRPGDRLLLACWVNREQRFLVKLHVAGRQAARGM